MSLHADTALVGCPKPADLAVMPHWQPLPMEAAEAWNALPVPILPRWLRRPLVDAWGDRAVQRMEQAHLDGAPVPVIETLCRDRAAAPSPANS